MNRISGEDGLRLALRVTPKRGQDVLEGFTADANGKPVLKARIAAVAEGGKANVALVALLAKEFGVPKSAVAIVRGAAARLKQVKIEGDGKRLAARLQAIGGGV